MKQQLNLLRHKLTHIFSSETSSNNKKYNPLTTAILNNDWSNVESQCKFHPHYAASWSLHPRLYDGRRDAYLLPIHLFCYNATTTRKKSIDTITNPHDNYDYDYHPPSSSSSSPTLGLSLLITAYPKGLLTVDPTHGRLPLHIACLSSSSLSSINTPIISLLLAHAPRAAATPDDYHNLPLHYACRYGASVTVVRLLLEAYPDGIRQRDRYGQLPIHLACKNCHVVGRISEKGRVDGGVAILEELVKCYPGSLREMTDSMMTVIDLVESYDYGNRDNVLMFLRGECETLIRDDDDDDDGGMNRRRQLPLHERQRRRRRRKRPGHSGVSSSGNNDWNERDVMKHTTTMTTTGTMTSMSKRLLSWRSLSSSSVTRERPLMCHDMAMNRSFSDAFIIDGQREMMMMMDVDNDDDNNDERRQQKEEKEMRDIT